MRTQYSLIEKVYSLINGPIQDLSKSKFCGKEKEKEKVKKLIIAQQTIIEKLITEEKMPGEFDVKYQNKTALGHIAAKIILYTRLHAGKPLREYLLEYSSCCDLFILLVKHGADLDASFCPGYTIRAALSKHFDNCAGFGPYREKVCALLKTQREATTLPQMDHALLGTLTMPPPLLEEATTAATEHFNASQAIADIVEYFQQKKHADRGEMTDGWLERMRDFIALLVHIAACMSLYHSTNGSKAIIIALPEKSWSLYIKHQVVVRLIELYRSWAKACPSLLSPNLQNQAF